MEEKHSILLKSIEKQIKFSATGGHRMTATLPVITLSNGTTESYRIQVVPENKDERLKFNDDVRKTVVIEPGQEQKVEGTIMLWPKDVGKLFKAAVTRQKVMKNVTTGAWERSDKTEPSMALWYSITTDEKTGVAVERKPVFPVKQKLPPATFVPSQHFAGVDQYPLSKSSTSALEPVSADIAGSLMATTHAPDQTTLLDVCAQFLSSYHVFVASMLAECKKDANSELSKTLLEMYKKSDIYVHQECVSKDAASCSTESGLDNYKGSSAEPSPSDLSKKDRKRPTNEPKTDDTKKTKGDKDESESK